MSHNTFISQTTYNNKLLELKQSLATAKDRITYLEAELKLRQTQVLRLEAQIDVVESLANEAQWKTFHSQINPITFSTLALNSLTCAPLQINGSNPNFYCSTGSNPVYNWSSLNTTPLPILTTAQLTSLFALPQALTTESLASIVAKAETTKKPKQSKWNGWTIKNK